MPTCNRVAEMSRRPGKKNGVRALLSNRSAKQRHSIGTKDGSIIAAIITIHMPRKDAAAPSHVWPFA